MSKEKDNDQQLPGGNNAPPANQPPPDKKPGVLTIEEHRKNLNIDIPVFAAVMQAEGWAAGKKIPEAAFKRAVEAFLGASMGGK